jgi:Holliday junction resolvasome RuvABC endonuclease subunit
VNCYVLGLDPGFACVGYALAHLLPDGEIKPVAIGVLRTEKSNKKANVFASEDNVRRSREISKFLRSLLKSENGTVHALCAETMSFPRSASVAAKMAMCWGVVSCLSDIFDVPVLQASPQGLKLKVAGEKTASKEDVQKALEAKFGAEKLAAMMPDVPPSLLEHPFDALGAIVACNDSEVLRLARRMSAK